jgi:hypothetical protein
MKVASATVPPRSYVGATVAGAYIEVGAGCAVMDVVHWKEKIAIGRVWPGWAKMRCGYH